MPAPPPHKYQSSLSNRTNPEGGDDPASEQRARFAAGLQPKFKHSRKYGQEVTCEVGEGGGHPTFTVHEFARG